MRSGFQCIVQCIFGVMQCYHYKKKFTIVQVKKIDDKKLETYQEIPNRHVAIWLLLRHVQREIQIFPLY